MRKSSIGGACGGGKPFFMVVINAAVGCSCDRMHLHNEIFTVRLALKSEKFNIPKYWYW